MASKQSLAAMTSFGAQAAFYLRIPSEAVSLTRTALRVGWLPVPPPRVE